MNHQPLVSIGMAIYRAEFLENLLSTLKNQTYKNVEYIVSIDSPNNSIIQTLIKDFQSSVNKVKVYIHRPALGPWGNADFVYKQSTGYYFMRLDDDDSFKQDTHIEFLVKELNKGFDYVLPNVDIKYWENRKHIRTRENIMSCFDNCYSKFEFASASIKEPAMFYYGMFKMISLRKLYHYIENRGNKLFFCEGVFAHGVASCLNGSYVPHETLLYRIHGKNVSATYHVKTLIFEYKDLVPTIRKAAASWPAI